MNNPSLPPDAPSGNIWALIVAGGSGTRVGGPVHKQLLPLADGREVLVHAVLPFEESSSVTGIVLVSAEEDIPRCRELIAKYKLSKVRTVVPGGKTRQLSVLNGLQALPDSCELVAIHDAARPFLPADALERVLKAASENPGGAALALPVTDTIVEAAPAKDAGQEPAEAFSLHGVPVTGLPDRSLLWAMQTPQVFHREALLRAHRKALEMGRTDHTDDVQVLKSYSCLPVYLVKGDACNKKITVASDL